MGVPNKSARIEHRSTRHANRSAPCTHVVGVVESCSCPSDRINVGSLDFVVSRCVDRVVAMVIRKDKQDVRFVFFVSLAIRWFRNEDRERKSEQNQDVIVNESIQN